MPPHSIEDPSLPSFSREVFKAAMVDRGVLNAKAAETVADMPSKATLRAMLLGVLQAPTRNLVSVLNAKNASLVYALQAYVNKQDGK